MAGWDDVNAGAVTLPNHLEADYFPVATHSEGVFLLYNVVLNHENTFIIEENTFIIYFIIYLFIFQLALETALKEDPETLNKHLLRLKILSTLDFILNCILSVCKIRLP